MDTNEKIAALRVQIEHHDSIVARINGIRDDIDAATTDGPNRYLMHPSSLTRAEAVAALLPALRAKLQQAEKELAEFTI